ncbi:MAG TPA: manganese efflux pump, partial [Bacteroidales bacterium]|nr:manganese efflux pump [Bacteroidales bacterium]
GIGFGVLLIKIIPAISIISATTFAFATLGIYFGKKIENILQGRLLLFGGIVLIGIGVQILFTHIYGIN